VREGRVETHPMRAAGAAEETVMRYQLSGGGWPVGQVLIPNSTIIDLGDKAEHQLTEFEKLARGRIPPLDTLALDADSAIALWRWYPFHRDRLRRHLDPFEEATFQRLLGMSEATLQRHWPQGAG
jgi:hypothetical protein